jgi:hypothetical protein
MWCELTLHHTLERQAQQSPKAPAQQDAEKPSNGPRTYPRRAFTVIPAKAEIHRYQSLMDSSSSLRYDRNDEFVSYSGFFSSLLEPASRSNLFFK